MERYQLNLEENRLSLDQIKNALAEISNRAAHFGYLEKYYKANNVAISSKPTPSQEGTPDNRVAVGFARKIIKTVTGYMYKAGLIKLTSQVKSQWFNKIDQAIKLAGGDAKTSKLGRIVSIFGSGIELLYINENADVNIAVLKPNEALPIYDFDIEPKLIALVRPVKTAQGDVIELYYSDKVIKYLKNEDEITFLEEAENYFGEVQASIYYNNDEMMGDFEPVIRLIDAYDTLMSDSLNELDRFANAYLVLKGILLNAEDAKEIKSRRILEIMEGAEASFLTKNIQDGFIENLKNTLHELIHQISHVPDLTDQNFAGQQTGPAMRFKLADFENLCAEKEIGFKQGLEQRIKLFSNILSISSNLTPEQYSINFSRNLPANLLEIGDIVTKFTGSVSHKTLLGLVPFVNNVEDELNLLEEEKKNQDENFNPYKD